ncbi:MAG: small, acid-soluble spore protein, alpha/beta type [Desulfitobacteriaceae bacterium]|nr:small, acid-soluble spore protein, alpha/beta type [Desulfitobacteriaceae bacterium]MDD4753696.1 small, acid-soluble spore protein, alpha/beta type [Desulfitobacteriaceae bacterium]
MARRRGIMSDQLKMEVAKELGFADTVQSEGFGAVPSRLCGSMVRQAIEIAERSITPTTH